MRIELASDAEAEEAVFENETLTLERGSKSVTGKITFKAEKFPPGTAEKTVGVTVAAVSSGVGIGAGKTVFKVKGVDIVKLTGSTDKTEFNTTDGSQTAIIDLRLETALETDLIVKGEVLAESTLSQEKLELPSPVKIKAGETTAAIRLTVAKYSEGVLAFGNFSTDNSRVRVDVPKMTFSFTYDGNSGYIASIRTNDEREFTVGETPVTKSFTVTLNKPAKMALDVFMEISAPNLAGATLNPEIVEFAVGETSKTVALTVTDRVFISDQRTAVINVNLVSLNDRIVIDSQAGELEFTALK